MSTAKKLYLIEQDNVFASNLQKLMLKKDITEAELARHTSIPQPTLHKILTGITNDPRGSTLSTLAGYFGVSIDELYYNATHNSTRTITPQSIPLLSWIDCLKEKEFITELNSNNWENWITAEFSNSSVFALESKPALTARFPINTIFIVNPNILPDDGDLIVVHYPDTNEATLREFTQDGPTKLLLPIIKNTETTVLNAEIKIVGVVVQTRINYKKIEL